MKQLSIIFTVAFCFTGALQAADTPKPADAPKTAFKTQDEKASYSIGLNIGKSFKNQGLEIESDALSRGIRDGFTGAQPALTEKEIEEVMAAYQADLGVKAQKRTEANKKEGETFLAENKKKEGVKATASGLQYKILKAGTGPKPKASDTVVVHYRGTLLNGNEFDSSYKRGEPATFVIEEGIRGWSEALQLMPVGSKWQVFIPSELAYGEEGTRGGPIGPHAALIFEIELISIKS
jgi:FKBP-type peptidyl-prolyl cis-trans isomerase FklB